MWHEGRRFALRHLRDFGLGKTSMEEIIQREAQELVAEFGRSEEQPIEVSWSLNVAVLNVIWGIVASESRPLWAFPLLGSPASLFCLHLIHIFIYLFVC